MMRRMLGGAGVAVAATTLALTVAPGVAQAASSCTIVSSLGDYEHYEAGSYFDFEDETGSTIHLQCDASGAGEWQLVGINDFYFVY